MSLVKSSADLVQHLPVTLV